MYSRHNAFLRCYERQFVGFVIEASIQRRDPFLPQLKYYVTKIFKGQLQSSFQGCDQNRRVIVEVMLDFLVVLRKNDPSFFILACIKFHAELVAFRSIFLKGIWWIHLFFPVFLSALLIKNPVSELYKWILLRAHTATIDFWNYFQFSLLIFDLSLLYLFEV